MSRASEIAAERWELSEDAECVVVVAGTTTCVAVMGDPMDGPTVEDARRSHLVAAAPTMLAALRLALAQLREDLEVVVRSHTRLAFKWRAENPLPSSFDCPESERAARIKKAAFEAASAAIAAAWPTVAPLSEFRPA